MRPLITLLLSVGLFSTGYSQDSTRITLIYKMDSSLIRFSKDTLAVKDCKMATYNHAAVTISTEGPDGLDEPLDIPYADSYQWEDSVMMILTLPAEVAKAERLRVNPVYHFVCRDSQDTSRAFNDPVIVNAGVKQERFVELKILSTPSRARAFLVPKLYWMRNPDLLNTVNQRKLDAFEVPQDRTPVTTHVLEYVYIVVFKLNNQYGKIEFRPNYIVRPKDQVSFDF